MNDKLKKAIADWQKQVQIATIGSIAAITPPSKRGAHDSKTAAARAKDGIKRLKESILSTFTPKRGYPAGSDNIFAPDGYNGAHLFVLKNEKGQKVRHTDLPILTSAQDALKWYIQNSSINKRGKRKVRYESKAFVSRQSILSQTAKEIAKSAGKFIAGWHSLFDFFGRKIQPFTTPAALMKAKGEGNSRIVAKPDMTLTAYNEAQGGRQMERYAQRLVDQDIPRTYEFYQRKMKKALEIGLEKALGLDKQGAKTLAAKIKLDL